MPLIFVLMRNFVVQVIEEKIEQGGKSNIRSLSFLQTPAFRVPLDLRLLLPRRSTNIYIENGVSRV